MGKNDLKPEQNRKIGIWMIDFLVMAEACKPLLWPTLVIKEIICDGPLFAADETLIFAFLCVNKLFKCFVSFALCRHNSHRSHRHHYLTITAIIIMQPLNSSACHKWKKSKWTNKTEEKIVWSSVCHDILIPKWSRVSTLVSLSLLGAGAAVFGLSSAAWNKDSIKCMICLQLLGAGIAITARSVSICLEQG